MKILVAVDGSPCTAKVAEYVASHAGELKQNPELHVLYVQPPIPHGLSAGYAKSLLGTNVIDEYYHSEAEKALTPARDVLAARGIPFEAGYKMGDIVEQINKYVKDHGIDLIVLGSHGHSAFKALAMGSIASKVLASSPIPVLLVR